MIIIDGSKGEGGGQILRTALALSVCTGKPVTLRNIRAGRKKPGLMRQHLTAVLAAGELCGAEIVGAEPGSTELRFVPGAVRVGDYAFSVGTAGSSTLVLQTVLPPLLACGAATFTLTLEGGTHNPGGPPFEFLEKTFFGALGAMGVGAELTLERPGFFPAGGGRFQARVDAPARLTPLEWRARGAIIGRRAKALQAQIPADVGPRELATLRGLLPLAEADCAVVEMAGSRGPGNALLVELETETHTTVFSAVGRRDLPASRVARAVADAVNAFMPYAVPVDVHLADQLLLPLALAGGGAFRTPPLSRHTLTNMETIRAFLDVEFEIEKEDSRAVLVRVTGASPAAKGETA